MNLKLGKANVVLKLDDIEESLSNVNDALNIQRESPRVFISYASIDKAFAKKLSDDLMSAGIETWFDETTFYSDNTELAFVYENNINENELTSLNINDDAIEDYFNTIDDHADLLNEIQ